MKESAEPPRLRDPARTRERILDAAQTLILDHGFGATTVDAVVRSAGITKGAFFHHFASKAELGHALVERYALLDREHLERNLARAEKLASDPLQQLLVLIGLFEEEFEALAGPYPGCLFASYVYENKLFDEVTMDVLRETMQRWRRVIRFKLEEIAARHPPQRAVDLDSLADLLYSLMEGAFVMTKATGDKTLPERQLAQLRTYLELLFAPEPTPPS